ncbi:MAG: putative toxin-antitoxin system toxin component, PIN family [Terriglobia bacterium]
MRIVFDTNVLARAHQFANGPARRALVFVATGSDVLILSQYLLQELRRTLAYPRVVKSSGLTALDISEYLDYLARVSSLVHPLPVPEKVLRDPADEPVLGTALAGNADVICTRDADFFTEEVRRFSAERGIQILSDLELLRALKLQR